MLLPHNALILAVDGGHMRLLRNRGRDGSIELETLKELTLDNPPTHSLSEPAPGRSFQSMGGSRSAYEVPDTHQRRKDAFCEAALDEAFATAGGTTELLLIAPAHVMGVLRKRIADRPGPTRTREILKDLTWLAPHALAERLSVHD